MAQEHQNRTPALQNAAIFAIALAAIPLGILIYKLPRYGLAFPYWDEILIAPLIEKARTGQLSFIDLWAQHNEHRPLFPRLVMLLLALPTRWNVAWILAANVVCGVGVFLLLAFLALRPPGCAVQRRSWWLLPVFSFLVFSWAQMENWIWGLELTVLLCTLAVVSATVLLPYKNWRCFAAATAMAVVASYSFANGLLVWFAALPVLCITPGLRREQKWLRIMLWATAAFLTIESYFVAYQKPGVSPPFSAVLKSPLSYLGYVVLYLGNPVVGIFSTPPWHGGPPHPFGWGHFLPGVAGILVFGATVLWLFRSRKDSLHRLAAWLSLAAFAVLSALATGVGRVGFGIAEGLNSRYMTTGALFWCALFAILAMGLDRRRLPPWTALAAAVALLALQASVVYHSRPWEENARWKRMGWTAVSAGYPASLYLLDLWGPDQEAMGPDKMRNVYFPILRRFELCGFRRENPPNPALAQAYLAEAQGFLARNRWFPALTYLDTASFFDPKLREAKVLREQVPADIRKRFEEFERAGIASQPAKTE